MSDAAHPEAERFTAALRRSAEPAWSRATAHRFVDELAEGTIDDAVFRRYLVQDYAFISSLVRLVGYAVASAPSTEAARRLTGFLGVLTDEEDDYFERAFDALDVPAADRTHPDVLPPTEALEDLLVRGGLEGGYAERLAVLLAVEWVYLEWATAIAEANPGVFYLREWIDLHADDDFAAFVGWLRDELDREGPELNDRRRRLVERHFRRAVNLEVDFFEAAYAD